MSDHNIKHIVCFKFLDNSSPSEIKKIEKLLDFDNRLKKQLIELRSLMLSI